MITDLNTTLTLQERIRLWLGEHHNQYVPLTTEDLAAELGKDKYDVYQAIYRLGSKGEIEVDKSDDNKIIGVKIIKLEPSSRTYQRAADRAKEKVDTPNDYAESISKMTALRGYLEKKLAILDMQKRAKEAGLPEDTVFFEPNDYAEEGLLLLNLMSDAFAELKKVKDENEMMGYDLAAAKRDNENLKRQQRDYETREYLATPAH